MDITATPNGDRIVLDGDDMTAEAEIPLESQCPFTGTGVLQWVGVAGGRIFAGYAYREGSDLAYLDDGPDYEGFIDEYSTYGERVDAGDVSMDVHQRRGTCDAILWSA